MNEEKKSNFFRDVIVVGFALFSMFFGAGNVIFPPYLGMESGQQWLAGFSAYYVADIGLALLGMFALLRVGSSEAVLHRVGRVPAEILMCAIILCIGPMVAIPRTSASTFEMAIAPNLPGVSPVLFSILFFAINIPPYKLYLNSIIQIILEINFFLRKNHILHIMSSSLTVVYNRTSGICVFPTKKRRLNLYLYWSIII